MASPSLDSETAASALVLGGGGARAAYQAGVLRFLEEAFPQTPFPLITGSGAGAFNAGVLAGQGESWSQAVHGLVETWTGLGANGVFVPRSLWDLVTQLVEHGPSTRQSLLDPSPLRAHLAARLPTDEDGVLTGIQRTLETEWLDAVAVTTSHYASLTTVTWAQGRPLAGWSDERRAARSTALTIDHLMAAGALTLLYPAVSIGGAWHGAGAGMLHPFSPALRLGADRVLAVSTRATPSPDEADTDESYPSPLQIASLISNTLLLDTLDADAAALHRIDRLARKLPPDEREGLEPADTLVLRPSEDLTDVADAVGVEVGATLGPVLQYLYGGGPHLPDLLSMLLFEPAYVRRLLLLGYTDAEREHERIEQFLRP